MTSSLLNFPLKRLDGAERSFSKFDKGRAEFFLKGENNIGMIATLETNVDGVFIDVQEGVCGDGEPR